MMSNVTKWSVFQNSVTYVYLVLYVYLVSKSVPDAYAYVAIVAMSTNVYLRITLFVGFCVGGSKIKLILYMP